MKKRFLYVGILVITSISSCSEPDKICDCITAGDQLNKKSAEILSKVPTKKDEKEIKTRTHNLSQRPSYPQPQLHPSHFVTYFTHMELWSNGNVINNIIIEACRNELLVF